MITLTLTQTEYEALRYAAGAGLDELTTSAWKAAKADLDNPSFNGDQVEVVLDGETFVDLRTAFTQGAAEFHPYDSDERALKAVMHDLAVKFENLSLDVGEPDTGMAHG